MAKEITIELTVDEHIANARANIVKAEAKLKKVKQDLLLKHLRDKLERIETQITSLTSLSDVASVKVSPGKIKKSLEKGDYEPCPEPNYYHVPDSAISNGNAR